MIVHPIKPVYNKDSKILILGSFPSVKSREEGFFYGHKKNRFWKVLSIIFAQKEPINIDEKREFLLKNHVAVWDVIKSCEIVGSSDATIKNALANDLSEIIDNSKVKRIFVNGKTAEKYYDKYLREITGITATVLPSTSPANAVYSIEKLVDEWSVIKE